MKDKASNTEGGQFVKICVIPMEIGTSPMANYLLLPHENPSYSFFLHRRHRFDDARNALFEATIGRGSPFFDQT